MVVDLDRAVVYARDRPGIWVYIAGKHYHHVMSFVLDRIPHEEIFRIRHSGAEILLHNGSSIEIGPDDRFNIVGKSLNVIAIFGFTTISPPSIDFIDEAERILSKSKTVEDGA